MHIILKCGRGRRLGHPCATPSFHCLSLSFMHGIFTVWSRVEGCFCTYFGKW